MTERELIEHIQMLMLADANRDPQDAVHFKFRGPYTTTYWSTEFKDNIPQQSMTVIVDGQYFDVIIRERKRNEQ